MLNDKIINSVIKTPGPHMFPNLLTKLRDYKSIDQNLVTSFKCEVVVPMTTIINSVDWLKKFRRDLRVDVIARAIEVLENRLIERLKEFVEEYPSDYILILPEQLLDVKYIDLEYEERDSIQAQLHIGIIRPLC